jgi:hypothetical protein
MPVHPNDSPIIAALIPFTEKLWDITAYGWRAVGSVPGSLHPHGRAADLMISSFQQGDEIADYLVKNAATFNAQEIIWNRRIWTPSKGWHPYTGPSPHTDHVHIGVGTGNLIGKIPGLGAVGDKAGELIGKAIGGSVNELKKSALMIAFGGLGLTLVMMGAQQMVTPTIRKAIGV